MPATEAPTRRRPPSVTAAIIVTAVLAVWSAVGGVLLLLLAGGTDQPANGVEPATYVLSGVVGVLTGMVLGAVAVGLARAYDLARVLLSLVLLFRLGYELIVANEVVEQHPVLTAVPLVVTVLGLGLVWNPAAARYFEDPRERALATALSGGTGQSRQRRVGRLLADYLVRMLVLGATIGITPSISVTEWWALPLATVVVALAGELVRPLLVGLTSLFGWLGSLALAFFGNAAVIGIGLLLTPGIDISSVGATVLASWVYALAMTLVSWAFSVNTQDYLLAHAVRMSRGNRSDEPMPEPGVLFIQLDGVSAPVLENEVKAGNLPTISRWVRSGSHTWREWVARVPSTTPVSQAGLLHGSTTDIPAFRWYEKDRDTLVVANHPPDSALIESRISDRQGLLADDGVSISNLFSGDATTSLLTMSGLRNPAGGLGPSASYAAFFTHPAGFFRAVLLTIGEMGKEIFQGRRQERLDVQPRIKRHGAYIALRGATNVFLRDLNVALIVEAMMSGAKSIYVDFVDYDEIAHHAGVTRPESMDSLRGLDSVIAGLEKIATSGATPRDYSIVLISDHGQSQGATFLQRSGESLEQVVRGLMNTDETAIDATGEVESWGPVNVFLAQLSDQESVSGRLTRRALKQRDDSTALGPTALDQQAVAQATSADTTQGPPVVVVGSGNLGGIWFPRLPGRASLADLEQAHPGLVQALANNPVVGFVVVMTREGPLAIGAGGTHVLETGVVTGDDPLGPFGADAAGDFARAARFEHAPDIYLNSLYDPVLDEVAAFEELVGCHGGIGGWQTRPVLVHPVDWPIDADLLDDRGRLASAEAVHATMVRWLERLGHRREMAGADRPQQDLPHSEASART